MTRALVILGGASAALTAAIVRSLADGSRLVTVDELERAARPRAEYADTFKVEAARDYERHSEVGQLRREHHWREKQARSMINARIKAQRRK